jgi:hypothetical protein
MDRFKRFRLGLAITWLSRLPLMLLRQNWTDTAKKTKDLNPDIGEQ